MFRSYFNFLYFKRKYLILREWKKESVLKHCDNDQKGDEKKEEESMLYSLDLRCDYSWLFSYEIYYDVFSTFVLHDVQESVYKPQRRTQGLINQVGLWFVFLFSFIIIFLTQILQEMNSIFCRVEPEFLHFERTMW